MPITITGSGTITGLSVGGLPDGTVDEDTLASGTGGKVIAVKSDKITGEWSGNGTTWTSIAGISITHAVANASNKLYFWFNAVHNFGSGAGHAHYRLHDGTSAICVGDSGNGEQVTYGTVDNASRNSGGHFIAEHTPGSGSKTYTVQARVTSGGGSFEIGQVDTDFNALTTLTMMEVAA